MNKPIDLPLFLTETIKLDNLLPPVEERLQSLPYDQISWENFEKLCHELAKKEKEVMTARQYGVKGDKQDGIDIYALSQQGRYSVYQCKNQKDFGKSKIAAAVKLFCDGEWANEAEKFVLCTRESLSSTSREGEIKQQRDILTGKGISFDVWDSSELNTKLKDHPQLVYNFFGLNWFIGFCGREKLQLIDLHTPLPDKNVYEQPQEYIERTVTKTNDDNFSMFFDDGQTLLETVRTHRKIALLAWGLDGKSTEMQYLASKLAKEDFYFPYLISLGTYSDESIASWSRRLIVSLSLIW